MGKGFYLNHQKVVLDVDLHGTAIGYTEISILPNDPNLRTVFLHSRECRINSVKVGPASCNFVLNTPLASAIAAGSSTQNIRSAYPEFKRKLYQAVNEGEEGELAITLPPDTVKRANQRTTAGSLAPGADGAASPDPGSKASKEAEYEPIIITINYEIRDPRDGIHVVRPSELYPQRIPHCYISAATADAARCWVPCLDTLWDRCTWELQIIVQRVLSYEQETDQGVEVEEFPMVCVASGELMEQVVHPHNPNKTIFNYSQAVPTSAQHIAFAYGPFSIIDVSPSAQQARSGELGLDEDPDAEALAIEAEGQLQLHAFCLPGREDELQNSVNFMSRALEFFVEELGSYPFNSFKMVFVDDAPLTLLNSATLGILSTELLYPASVIDQTYETRQTLSYSLAAQWVGINIIQKTWADTWLIQGLSLYINGLCLKRLMGNNEYRFRLKKDVTRCCAWDVKMPPLSQPGILQPPSVDVLPFINLKAPLVLHILDRQLLKAGTHNGLARVIPKLFLSAISGDLKENLLSTHNFLRMCRKVSGADLRGFAEQWIYSAGCPRFHIAANFNRKRMAVELAIKQESPAAQYAETCDWSEKVNLKPINIFEGQMTVRIHEADGTPYEHVIDIREQYKKHEVGFNTKYKRIRRSTKRFQARKAAEEAAAAGDPEAIEAVGEIDTSFSLPLWEDSKNENTGKEREKWKVADWSEEDEKIQEQAVYEWIRIDTEFEWIASISFEQPDFMWISQLQRDRDVIAQLEAVHALARMQTAIVSSTLAKTVLVTNYFYRIRMEAALALVSSSVKSLDYLGLFYLFKIFQTRYCFEPEEETSDPLAFRCVPRPNDFSDFAEYHLRKSLIVALSHVRDERGNPIPQIQRFLIDLLKYNDNAVNPYSDAFYATTIIAALGNPFVAISYREQSEFSAPYMAETQSDKTILHAAVDEVTRYTNLDRLVPSYRNVVTVAAIEWRVKMMLASLIPVDIKLLLSYTREGNYPAVRNAAFDGLLLLRALQEKVIARYIFAVLRFDSSRLVQRRLAQSLVENLPVLAAMDELGGQESAGYTEEEAKAVAKPAQQSIDSMLKALRNSVGRSIMLRDSMMAVLLSSNVDVEIRWCILKLCEVLIKPSEEALPKIKLRMSSNAARVSTLAKPATSEVPLALASGTGGIPRIKIGGPESAYKEPSTEAQSNVAQPLKLVLGNKKAPKLLKEQKSGMNIQDLKVCQNLMQKLTNTKKANLFRNPVDPIRDGAPSYFEHIKKPMDLSTMANKLSAGLYKDRFEFKDDFKLMINNCYIYNGRDSIAGKMGEVFDAQFDKQWERANATLEQLRLRAEANAAAKAEAAAAKANLTFKTRAPPAPSPTSGPAPSPAGDGSGSTVRISPLPSAPPAKAPTEGKLSSPQPPPAPATGETPTPSTLKSFTLKLSLTSPSPGAAPGPQSSTSPVPQAPPSGDPVKPERVRSATPARLATPAPSAASPAVPSAPTPAAPVAASSTAPSATPASGPSAEEPVRPSLLIRDSRSSSPAVPLAAQANGSAPSLPKIKFSAKPPKPKPEPVEETVESAVSMPPPPPRASASVEPSPANGQPKTKKIRLSINGMGGLSSSSSSPAATKPSPSPAPGLQASATPPPAKTKPASSHAKSSGPPSHRASSSGSDSSQPVNVKKMQGILKKLVTVDESFFFRRPVDPVADGCPTYYDEIKRPMDLGTMMSKLSKGKYHTQQQMNEDFDQIVTNCKIFNPPGTLPVAHAEALQKMWKSEVAKAGRMNYAEKRALQGMMNRLRAKPIAQIFLEPVDPEALGIPMYFKIIPKRDARDMSLIKRKLDNDEYTNFDAFEADFRLMINNCLVFNGEDSAAYDVGKMLEAEFDKEFDTIKAQLSGGVPPSNKSVKRSSTSGQGGSSNGGVTKKIKLSFS